MKIVMLKGSPHRHGSSNMLASEFARGAEEAGHEIVAFDIPFLDVHPCIGCGKCGMNGPCVFKDDNQAIKDALLDSDMVVFVTPIYYFGLSAQLKAVIDRFYSYTTRLSNRGLKTALITAAWDSNDDVMPYLVSYYEKLCRYMSFSDVGMVLGLGCGNPNMTAASPFLQDAYELGRNLS